LRFIHAEARVNETDRNTVSAGQDDASRIEVWLCNDQFVEFIAGNAERSASPQSALMPEPHKVRWIRIPKLTVFDHSGQSLSGKDRFLESL
jgi:hypothetical protein